MKSKRGMYLERERKKEGCIRKYIAIHPEVFDVINLYARKHRLYIREAVEFLVKEGLKTQYLLGGKKILGTGKDATK